MSEAIDLIESALSSGWNSANTDSVTPQFQTIYETFSADYGMHTTYVLFYTRNTQVTNAQAGSANHNEVENISVNIRTMKSRDHAVKCLKEAIRLLKANMKLNNADGHYVRTSNWTDHSDKRRKIWEFTLECTVTRFNV